MVSEINTAEYVGRLNLEIERLRQSNQALQKVGTYKNRKEATWLRL